MKSTDNLRRQHRELLRLAALVTECTTGAILDARKVRAALSQVSGILNVHLAMEDGVLYPQLMRHADPAVRNVAKKFIDEMGGLRTTFTDYVHRWNAPATILERQAEFVRETSALFSALGRRIGREDEELYALVDSLADAPKAVHAPDGAEPRA